MTIRPLLIAVSIAALCACSGSNKERDNASAENRDRDGDRDRSGNDERSRDGDRARDDDRGRDDDRDRDRSRDDRAARDDDTGSGSGDPQLARELADQVRTMRATLPQRDGIVTINDVESEGTEITYRMRISQDLNDSSFQRFRDELPRRLCNSDDTEALLRRGGVYTYIVTDTEGEQFNTSVRRC